MQTEPGQLQDIFLRLQGDKIVNYSYDGNTLRLEIETSIAALVLPESEFLNLILQNCPTLSYLSYTQTLAARIELRQPEQIFSKGLAIQGVELRPNRYYLIYCNSYLSKIEAGELHLRAHDFQLYDQEFGRIQYPTFIRQAEKIKRS